MDLAANICQNAEHSRAQICVLRQIIEVLSRRSLPLTQLPYVWYVCFLKISEVISVRRKSVFTCEVNWFVSQKSYLPKCKLNSR